MGSDPLSAWWLGLAPATLEFWVRFPNERNQGKQAHPVLKYRVPQGSQPRPGWAPDPLMVGIRSPIGLVVGSCTRHPGVLGSIPKREEPGKTGAPCVKLPVSSRVPRLVVSHSTCPPLSSSTPREQLCNRSCSNKHTLSATSAELGLGLGLGLGLDSLSHSSSHALPFFSPPSFHTLSLSPAFTSVWWSALSTQASARRIS